MERQDQINTTRRALELELEISAQSSALDQLDGECFRQPPQPPVKRQVHKVDPPIKTTIKVNWALVLVLLIFTFIGPLIYYFAYLKPAREKETAQIKSSAEYRQRCAEAEAEYQRESQLAEEEYRQARHKYETETLAEYNEELEAWTEEHNKRVSQANRALAAAQEELAALYENSKLIPMQYRYIPALQYIYDMISTSDYSIREAIESFDKSEQRKLDQARLQEQAAANQLASEQNKIAEKTRRDAAISSVVGAVQRHNLNKTLKDFGKK